jgi:hypothetical protein
MDWLVKQESAHIPKLPFPRPLLVNILRRTSIALEMVADVLYVPLVLRVLTAIFFFAL